MSRPPTTLPPPAPAWRKTLEVFAIFLRLGLTSFGGPTAHLGYFQTEFVQRQRWLSDAHYAELVALCQFLPGPASSQVGMALGQWRAGWAGMAAAWLGFTLPSALALMAPPASRSKPHRASTAGDCCMFYQVRPALLDAWLGQFNGDAAKPVVLDVREKWECQVASVAPSDQFELLCIPMGEITSRLNELDPDRPIACLCHHGARSMSVAAYLAREGFESVANITGGIAAWAVERDPSVPQY